MSGLYGFSASGVGSIYTGTDHPAKKHHYDEYLLGIDGKITNLWSESIGFYSDSERSSLFDALTTIRSEILSEAAQCQRDQCSTNKLGVIADKAFSKLGEAYNRFSTSEATIKARKADFAKQFIAPDFEPHHVNIPSTTPYKFPASNSLRACLEGRNPKLNGASIAIALGDKREVDQTTLAKETARAALSNPGSNPLKIEKDLKQCSIKPETIDSTVEFFGFIDQSTQVLEK